MDQRSAILVVGPAWVGDLMMAQSLLMVLKNQSGSDIDVVAPPWALPIVKRMPEVRNSYALKIAHGELGLAKRYRLARDLADQNYQLAIVLPNSWKAALLPFLAGIPQRRGYLGELRWGLLNQVHRLDKKRLRKTVERFVGLAAKKPVQNAPEYPNPQLVVSAQQSQLALAALEMSVGEQPILAMCPGAEFGSSKRWPVRYFADVAKHFHKAGWQVWLFGSAKDAAICEQIQQLSDDRCINLAAKTDLLQAIDLMALVNSVLTNDSGLMHIAAALNKPLVAVYGSTDPNMTPPLSNTACMLSSRINCAPCFERECRFQHLECLTKIHPQTVIAELESLCGF